MYIPLVDRILVTYSLICFPMYTTVSWEMDYNVGNPICYVRKTQCAKWRTIFRSSQSRLRGQPNNKLLVGGMISGTYQIAGPNDESLGQWSMVDGSVFFKF